jgi:hypothetical protein
MILARFQFREDAALDFIDSQDGSQVITEMEFDSVEELIEVCRGFEGAILNCTASINGQVVDLKAISA